MPKSLSAREGLEMAPLFAWTDSSLVLIILSVLGGLIVLPYAFGPMLIYFTLKISGNPELDELSLDDPTIPREVKNYVLPAIQQVKQDGFEVLGVYFIGSLVPNVRCFAVLLGNRPAQDKALLAATYAETPAGIKLQQTHIEYSTRFDDGTVVDTNNSEELSAFKRPPEQRIVSLPWVKDVRRLYRVHRAVIEREHSEKRKAWRLGADVAVFLREALIEENTKQLATGYLYRDAAGDFRPTVKGALMMTWKNLPPFTQILKARRNQAGQRLLQELGV